GQAVLYVRLSSLTSSPPRDQAEQPGAEDVRLESLTYKRTMSSFTFLSPWYLIGLSAALIPLIIHLSRSRRTKKMRFSTTRFFTDQFLRSYRMSRLKELLLLACRMCLFFFLALALTEPLFRFQGTPPAR